MRIYRVYEQNGRIYLGQQNNSVYIYSDSAPVPDVPGTIYYLLYASGWLYDSTGNLVSTTTSTNSAGTGGELLLSRPAQGWYRVEAEEQWRVSGPSGEASPIIHSVYCGDPENLLQFVENP